MAGLTIPEGLIKRRELGPKHQPIKLDLRRFGTFKGAHATELPEYRPAAQRVVEMHELLMEGKSDLLKDGPVVMTGWKTESPYASASRLHDMNVCAKRLSESIDAFWSVGIGGSYLGLRAAIEAVRGSLELFNLLPANERGGTPMLFFLGNHMDPSYTARALQIMNGLNVGGNVISKSGGTVEPAIVFAILKQVMEDSYTSQEVADRIIAITDEKRGALRELASQAGYTSYVVPDNVGGRYSVTSAVGLFSLAVAGLDIDEFIAGSRFAEEQARSNPFDKNISFQRAVMRYLAHKAMGKKIEVASTGVYDLQNTLAWMVQLGPESEGKNGEGLFLAPEYYTSSAHANGQLIQMGERNLIETFLMVEQTGVDLTIPGKGTPVAYLDGKPLHFANTAFVEGLRDAHYESGVPTMSYVLPYLDAFTMGMFYQLEMNAIALSALLLGQNPFIQPGVQQYKDVANARSGKPGTEAAAALMREAEAKLDPKLVI